jgi:hypothetical protein
MAQRRQDIDRLLADWPFQPGEVSARLVKGGDGREVLQMRVEMGVLQMEVDNRPDGQRPGGSETYFDHLLALSVHEQDFELSTEQCAAADREFLQFYHRRICWLALREFKRAVRDADHSLAFMDFVRAHSPDEQWTLSHEQYRPFVLFHRTQAAALAALEETGPEAAIDEVSRGLDRFRNVFREYEAEEQFEEDELVERLMDLRMTLRKQYKVKPTLSERLADAVANEKYELAAMLRDEMRRRSSKQESAIKVQGSEHEI